MATGIATRPKNHDQKGHAGGAIGKLRSQPAAQTRNNAGGSTRIGGDLEHAMQDLDWMVERFRAENRLFFLKQVLPLLRQQVEEKGICGIHQLQLQQPENQA